MDDETLNEEGAELGKARRECVCVLVSSAIVVTVTQRQKRAESPPPLLPHLYLLSLSLLTVGQPVILPAHS